jgi:hypothetical protein
MSIPLNPEQWERKDKPIRSMPTRSVRLDKVVSTQNDYDPAKVENMAQGARGNKVPVAVKKNGKYHILDGHHRVASDILNGNDRTELRIVK